MVMRDPTQAEMENPDLAAKWICAETGEIYEVTPAMFKEWQETPGKVMPIGDDGPRIMVFKNEKIDKYTIVKAAKSPFNGEWYPKYLPDGSRPKAPGQPN